ncbi:MAG: phospholipase A [Mariprofundaceae bacterium]|nr:phospholipase A [Mariprofundaceae bacterium]
MGDEIGFIKSYRQNYILFYTDNNRNNFDAVYGPTLGSQYLQNEAKYQISFQGALPSIGSFTPGFAYTQQSYWQVYNTPLSAPFRENNFEPELFVSWDGCNPLKTGDAVSSRCQVGFDHQSNGRSNPYSRSWNRIYGEVQLENPEKELFGSLRGWFRIPEKAANDDNPDITHYYGYWQFDGRWTPDQEKRHTFHMMLRDNLHLNHNKGAVQLDWSWNMEWLGEFSTYVQFFHGYGENLIDYRQVNTRFGAGILLTNW